MQIFVFIGGNCISHWKKKVVTNHCICFWTNRKGNDGERIKKRHAVSTELRIKYRKSIVQWPENRGGWTGIFVQNSNPIVSDRRNIVLLKTCRGAKHRILLLEVSAVRGTLTKTYWNAPAYASNVVRYTQTTRNRHSTKRRVHKNEWKKNQCSSNDPPASAYYPFARLLPYTVYAYLRTQGVHR